MNWAEMSLAAVVTVFVVSGIVILLAGTWLTVVADRLADQTGMGEAIFGAVFLGATTSISGSLLSVMASLDGYPDLAVSNALGGIAAQTMFLCLADMSFRKANLEHAAASHENLMLSTLMNLMLALVLLAIPSPNKTFFGIHPMSVILIVTYLFGLRYIQAARIDPMWNPRWTRETKKDEPDESPSRAQLKSLIVKFALLAGVIAAAGYTVEKSAVAISERTGFDETLMGSFLTSITTSLPELVTTLASVHRGALTLAVGGIIGGNSFDVLFVAFSDFAFREGSIYHAVSPHAAYMGALSILMNTVLLMGLLRRETHGVANIGTESLLTLLIYLVGSGILIMMAL